MADTARAFIELLEKRAPSPRISVIDHTQGPADWGSSEIVDLSGGTRLRFDSACLVDGAQIHELWLSDFALVTISDLVNSASQAIQGMLDAQALVLPKGGGRDVARIREAYVSLGSDLCILCGELTGALGATPSRWWAMSRDAAALDAAAARASGLTARSVPALRYLSRCEVVDLLPASSGAPTPQLEGHGRSTWSLGASRFLYELGCAGHAVGQDCTKAWRNLQRTPDFLRRRWEDFRASRGAGG